MTIKELLTPASHGLPVRIIYLGEAENTEQAFCGTCEQAIESAYADYNVDAWEPVAYWMGFRQVNIYISMREEEIRSWYGGK